MLFQPLQATPVTITGDDAITFEEHAGRLVNLSAAAGQAITLPAATGSGVEYKFRVATTITSNSTTIKCASASDSFLGFQVVLQDGGSGVIAFEAEANDDTITLNGGTTGGIVGDYIQVIDAEENLFQVKMFDSATGTEATSFSATVS